MLSSPLPALLPSIVPVRGSSCPAAGSGAAAVQDSGAGLKGSHGEFFREAGCCGAEACLA